MKNESNKDTLKFIKEIVLDICTITATPLCGIMGGLAAYFGGIYNTIIFWAFLVLCIHNVVIPFYKYKIKDKNWDDARPSSVLTILCLMAIVVTLCFKYIAPKISNAGYGEPLKESNVYEMLKYIAGSEAVQKSSIDDANPSSTIYIVQKGDTLYKLAQKYNTTIDKILDDNIGNYPMMTRDYIDVGWELTITR